MHVHILTKHEKIELQSQRTVAPTMPRVAVVMVVLHHLQYVLWTMRRGQQLAWYWFRFQNFRSLLHTRRVEETYARYITTSTQDLHSELHVKYNARLLAHLQKSRYCAVCTVHCCYVRICVSVCTQSRTTCCSASSYGSKKTNDEAYRNVLMA